MSPSHVTSEPPAHGDGSEFCPTAQLSSVSPCSDPLVSLSLVLLLIPKDSIQEAQWHLPLGSLYVPHQSAMASRSSLSRLSSSLLSSSKVLRPTTANLSTSSSAAKLISGNALATTPLARVSRSAPRYLVGEEQRRAASSDEKGQTMVNFTFQVQISSETLTWSVDGQGST